MFIHSTDAQLFALDFGAGQRELLAVGGWAGSWEVWAPTLASLSRSWRVAAYDHRGTGATVCPVESITIANMVDDILAVVEGLELARPVLAAESAGATIALLAVLRHPERFAGLALVDGVIHHEQAAHPFAAGLRADFDATIAAFAASCVPESEPDAAAVRRWGVKILERSGQTAAIALYESVAGIDLRSRLGDVSLPALVIHGTADALVPEAKARELVAALPQAALHLIPGAGHVPTMTRPDEVARALDEFFSSSSAL
jgi:pimeloyl-ACP methyl ester carboxylesterase